MKRRVTNEPHLPAYLAFLTKYSKMKISKTMGKKSGAILAFVASLIFLVSPVLARPTLQSATLTTSGTQRTLTLPPAADNSNVIFLGTAPDPGTGQLVEGYAIVHYQPNPSHKPNQGTGGAKTTACYTYLSAGAKWKTLEPWVVNPANTRNLDSNTVFNILSGGIAKWEDATDGNVTNGTGVDVLGSGSTTSQTLVADLTAPDNQNEVYFADITDPGVIAVTIVWGIFGGPPFQRQLVEWDQVYDDVSFDWSTAATGVAGKMDFDNIATHELGHSVGMGDLYNSCTEETMYGYANFAETKKRDLNSGDITGIHKLY